MRPMPLTPETLARHELTGLDVRVVDAPNADLVGLAGIVREETMRTLVVETTDGETRVPKGDTTFRFTLPDGRDVRVDGDRLCAPPARRTETGGHSPWV